jgi:dienelactone hydrolase
VAKRKNKSKISDNRRFKVLARCQRQFHSFTPMKSFLLLSVFLTLGFNLSAAPAVKPKNSQSTPGDEMIAEYFRTETAKLAENCLNDIHTVADWNAKKSEYRRQLFDMLGLWPMPEKTDLKPVITGKLEHPEFTVEKLQFQSLPGLYITANVYVPRHLTNRAPTILYVCGHSKVITNGVSYGNKTAYQEHGAWFARNGYVCLVLDTIQLGEIQGIHHGTHREKMWWWNSRGYTPAGVEAWNAIRALDYLQSRADVDASRFGVTGRSGGGAHSWYLTALDDRIKVSVPVAGITDLQNYVVDGCVEGHCDCMFMMNTYRWDYGMLAALTAPRPLLLGNSDKDRIFPLDGVMRIHSQIKRVYKLHDATNNFGLLITEGPHEDTQDLQMPAFRWFNRFLKGEKPIIDMAATNHFTPAELKVFAALPKDERTSKIHETFVAAAPTPSIPQSKTEWEQRRDGWRKFLDQKVFAAWPKDIEPAQLRSVSNEKKNDMRIQQFEFVSQEKIILPLYVVGNAKAKRLVVRVLDQTEWDSVGKVLEAGLQNPSELANEKEAAIAFILPRGIGPTAWTSDLSKATHIRRRFMLLGTTLDAMRVWDIRRAIEALTNHREFKRLPLELHGSGEMGVNALYASLFVQPLKQIELSNLPTSHSVGPDYLNVLKSFDIPQAVAMAAEKSSMKLRCTDSTRWNFPISTARSLGWKTIVLEP